MSTRDQFAVWMESSHRENGADPSGPPVPSAETVELEAVKAELNALKQANAQRDLRAMVAAETGVPAELLTGETEDVCRAQAAAIGAYVASIAPEAPVYPRMQDSGEVRMPSAKSARELFSEWMGDRLSFDPFRR